MIAQCHWHVRKVICLVDERCGPKADVDIYIRPHRFHRSNLCGRPVHLEGCRVSSCASPEAARTYSSHMRAWVLSCPLMEPGCKLCLHCGAQVQKCNSLREPQLAFQPTAAAPHARSWDIRATQVFRRFCVQLVQELRWPQLACWPGAAARDPETMPYKSHLSTQ